MITKMERNNILTALNGRSSSASIYISADRTNMKIDRDTNMLLEIHRNQYEVKTGKKISKAGYLWTLLRKFRDEQPALLRYDEIDPYSFDAGMLPALQQFKRICKRYIDKKITTQSQAVTALIYYSTTRAYEVANNFPTQDYLDNEYESDMEEAKLTGEEGYVLTPDHVGKPAPVVRHMSPSDLTELYEES
jgi:hypothetical protein